MGKGKKSRVKPPSGVAGRHVGVPAPSPAPASTNHLHPVFNLEHLQGDFCLTRCTSEEKAAFAETIHRLSRMTWQEIQQAHRHGLGFEKISRDAIGDRALPAEMTDDVPLLAFRFFAKAPMVGYRNDRVFTVLFLDRSFTLYNHG